MALTDIQIKKAKPTNKLYKLADGGGLCIVIYPTGKKSWRYRYRIAGKEKTLSLGLYPEVGLKVARKLHFAARQKVSQGIDPSAQRKAEKASHAGRDTFEAVACEWLNTKKTWSESHTKRTNRRLERDIFPYIGKYDVHSINAPQLLEVIRRIEKRGVHETARRVLQVCGQVFRYAIATGRAERDCAADLRGALTVPKAGHFASITDPKEFGALMRSIAGYEARFVTICALRIAPYVFVRPSELRHAEWQEIDLDAALWSIPAEKMKMKVGHVVPLARQVVDIIRELQPLTSNQKYLFPSARTRGRAMSDAALLSALRRMEYTKEEMTVHGFRAAARTMLDEILYYRIDYIEQQLAHAVKDPLGRAYNRTTHLPARTEMMQTWANYIDALRDNGDITLFIQNKLSI
ncbi:MAG: integrase arm-type DNA-binding domain-containing protein [Mariprofundales bacterium]